MPRGRLTQLFLPLSFCNNHNESCLRVSLSRFEETVGHRRGSDGGPAEAREHGGAVVAAVEVVFEEDGALGVGRWALGVGPWPSSTHGGIFHALAARFNT